LSLSHLHHDKASFDQALSASVLANANSSTNNALLKKKKSNQPNDNYKVSLCNHWLLDGVCHFNEDCHFAHGEEEINDR
jgi:Zinc finger C-x8-C-x5-C-x3-H type (and similar)